MKLLCPFCGGETAVPGDSAFLCACCGKRLIRRPYGRAFMLEAAPDEPKPGEAEALALVEKALLLSDPAKQKKLLDQATALCPNCLEAHRQLLYLGNLYLRDPRHIDLHKIKCYLLHAFDHPEEEANASAMIAELTGACAELQTCLSLAPDPQVFLSEYLLEMCRRYISVFMKSNNSINGTIMGLRVFSLEKCLAPHAARIIRNMEKACLPEPYDRLLPEAMKKAFSLSVGGTGLLLEQELQKQDS